MKTTISKSFLDGFARALSLDSTKEWPNIYDDKMKDYMALRGDGDNVGKAIRKETRNFKRTSFRH